MSSATVQKGPYYKFKLCISKAALEFKTRRREDL